MIYDCDQKESASGRSNFKCVIWDLDETIWDGTLLEGDEPVLRPNVKAIIEELDNRGILNAVVSKNEFSMASDALICLGIVDYFVCSHIKWCNKSESVKAVAEDLGIGLDSFLFVDDQEFERDEVHDALPEVETFDPANLNTLLAHPRMQPRYLTSEAKQRRKMYQADFARKQSEADFVGTRWEFLQTLDMRVTIRPASEADLLRIEELTNRTNQLNTTGRPYSQDALRLMLGSDHHRLLVVDLHDRYGSSGTIGLALIGTARDAWLINLLIVSCRVISRGIGSLLLSYILFAARDNGVSLRAEFVDSGRNRMMYITYRFAGFREADVREADSSGIETLLCHDLKAINPIPSYFTLTASGL